MRVFGKRNTEQKKFDSHTQRIRASGTLYRIFEAEDEICLSKSSVWNETDSRQVSNHLSNKVNEPKELIVYPKASVWVTVNLEAEQLSHGQVGVFQKVPTGYSVSIYVQYSSGGEVDITPQMLEHDQYLTWRTVTKETGFVQPFEKNLVRRVQLQSTNFAAMTTHKIMDDTIKKLATSISANGSSYEL